MNHFKARSLFCCTLLFFVACCTPTAVGATGCWILVAGTSCAGRYGDRLPDTGCTGCSQAGNNTVPHCNWPNGARRSTSEANWGTIRGALSVAWDEGYFNGASGWFHCATEFDCDPKCVFNLETNDHECLIISWTKFWSNDDMVWNPGCVPVP